MQCAQKDDLLGPLGEHLQTKKKSLAESVTRRKSRVLYAPLTRCKETNTFCTGKKRDCVRRASVSPEAAKHNVEAAHKKLS